MVQDQSDELNQQLSAAMDGELNDREAQALVDELLVNPQLREKWREYHQTQACIHAQSQTMFAPANSFQSEQFNEHGKLPCHKTLTMKRYGYREVSRQTARNTRKAQPRYGVKRPIIQVCAAVLITFCTIMVVAQWDKRHHHVFAKAIVNHSWTDKSFVR